jgi:hypothetical protein
VFDLKEPPPPAAPVNPAPPLPKIFLTGISTISGNKRVLLKTAPSPAPGQPAAAKAYVLSEGEADGDLQIVEVDEKKGVVKLSWAGTLLSVNFEENGIKASGLPMAEGPVLPSIAPPRPVGFNPLIRAPGEPPRERPAGSSPTGSAIALPSQGEFACRCADSPMAASVPAAA